MGFNRAPEDRPTPKEVYNYRPYMFAIISCSGSWMFGYNVGTIAGVLVLPSFVKDFHLPTVGTKTYNEVTSNIVSLLQIGGLVGSMLTFPVMKLWGRKVSLVVWSLVFFLGGALQTFSYGNLGMMYAGRLIAGLGTGGTSVVVPLYITELSPPAIRGSLVGLYEVNNQFSLLLGYWICYLVNRYLPPTSTKQWQLVVAIQMIPSFILFMSALFILPESPRFLVMRRGDMEARKVLAYIRNLDKDHNYINQEIEMIEEAIAKQEAVGQVKSRLGLFGELWWKGNRRRVIIGLGLMLGQNMTGTNGVNFYTPTIFKSIGFDGTNVILLASGMYAVVKSVATIFSIMVFVDRFGRRKLFFVSSIGTSLPLWYIGAFITAAHVDFAKVQQRTPAGWVAIVCVYIYAAFFSLGWSGPVSIYCSEIFPIRIKELSFCLATAMQWLSQFAVARFSPFMISSLHGGFFFFFASCITVALILIFFFVPETKGRSLEGMDAIFGNAYARVVEVELERAVSRREGAPEDKGERMNRVVSNLGLGLQSGNPVVAI